MPGTLVLPLDDSAAGELALAAALRTVSDWNSSLLILVPPDLELQLDGFNGGTVASETLQSSDAEALIERLGRCEPPVTLVLSFAAVSQPGWLGSMTLELLHHPPATLLMADPPASPRVQRASRGRGRASGRMLPPQAPNSKIPAGRG